MGAEHSQFFFFGEIDIIHDRSGTDEEVENTENWGLNLTSTQPG
jgi:hypothetical protein